MSASNVSHVKIGRDVKTGELVCIGDIERRSGLYVLGKPGMGKTTLLVNVIDQDLEHGHGLFFLDPHGDAISDLARSGSLFGADLEDRVFLIDPETEESSFGINLLACPCVSSLKARTDTYTKAYSVFYKLWEESWGPWLQLIIQNTLYVFIENQEYTLSEVPLFLTDASFRDHLVGKMQYNREVSHFWRYEFGQRLEKDQEIQVQAALTRVRTLLNHQYVRDIVGQHKTTVNFSSLMEGRGVLLVKLSASLAPDIKKFIGTILVSELLQAARGRVEGRRHQFCVFVDEFQNFATEDFSALINEARKFGIATTIAHQERYGQFGENRAILGATSACANKVFFQLTVKDAQELAPEFAEKPEGTEARHEAQLVISPRAFEDIWERGHPDPVIASYRPQYFWLVDWLRLNPQQKYIEFDPAGIRTARGKEEAGRLHPECFNDWTMYRASTDMLKEGIALLNQYYYDYMMGIEIVDTAERIVKLIVLWGGVFGLRRRMVLCIPEELERWHAAEGHSCRRS